MSQPKKSSGAPQLQIAAGVVRSIRQHARSSMKTEVCGVLIGSEEGGRVIASASIQGVNAAQGGAHVTFTQETWEHIYQIKDKEYPDDRIVGWYHSHPSFGIFLSDHDLFIHQNFFSSPMQVAWVYDPVSDEEGCFGWVNGKVERLTRITVRDGEEDRGTVENRNEASDDELEDDEGWRISVKRSETKEVSTWLHWTGYVLTHLLAVTLGLAGAIFLFLPANMQKAFGEGYVTAISDVSMGSLRLPPGMTVAEFQAKTGLDRLRRTEPPITVPGNLPPARPEKRP